MRTTGIKRLRFAHLRTKAVPPGRASLLCLHRMAASFARAPSRDISSVARRTSRATASKSRCSRSWMEADRTCTQGRRALQALLGVHRQMHIVTTRVRDAVRLKTYAGSGIYPATRHVAWRWDIPHNSNYYIVRFRWLIVKH